MLNFVEHRRGETISWRDPADIRSEIGETSKAFATLWERYAALEAARDLLRDYRQDDSTSEAFDCLAESARLTCGEMERYTEHLTELEKEMRDTLCLLQRM